MKKIFFALLLAPVFLFGQNERVFSGKCAISQTGGGSGYWTVSITNFNDPGGLWDASEISVGDKVFFSDGGTPYSLEIDTIISKIGTTASVRVSNTGVTGISSVPTTNNAFISRGTPNLGLYPWIANLSGNDNQLGQEYNMYLIDLAGQVDSAYYVSINGYKGTGTERRGDPSHPWQYPWSAKEAASGNDRIVVMEGFYNYQAYTLSGGLQNAGLGKESVSYHLAGGAIIDYTGPSLGDIYTGWITSNDTLIITGNGELRGFSGIMSGERQYVDITLNKWRGCLLWSAGLGNSGAPVRNLLNIKYKIGQTDHINNGTAAGGLIYFRQSIDSAALSFDFGRIENYTNNYTFYNGIFVTGLGSFQYTNIDLSIRSSQVNAYNGSVFSDADAGYLISFIHNGTFNNCRIVFDLPDVVQNDVNTAGLTSLYVPNFQTHRTVPSMINFGSNLINTDITVNANIVSDIQCVRFAGSPEKTGLNSNVRINGTYRSRYLQPVMIDGVFTDGGAAGERYFLNGTFYSDSCEAVTCSPLSATTINYQVFASGRFVSPTATRNAISTKHPMQLQDCTLINDGTAAAIGSNTATSINCLSVFANSTATDTDITEAVQSITKSALIR